MKPWVYIAPDLVDCGIMGENMITFLAWIRHEVDDPRVTIKRVWVSIRHADDEKAQEVEITNRILTSHYTLEYWEREILANYKKMQATESETDI